MTGKFSMIRPALVLTSVLALAACSEEPLGVGANTQSFGLSNHHNLLVQAAYIEQGSILRNLAEEFERDVSPTVNFDFNSDRLSSEARKILADQAQWLIDHPTALMQITGYADAVGTEVYNIEIGQRRAEAVLNFLVSRGVEEDRLDALGSLGESNPVVAVDAAERRNRRAVTSVIGTIYEYSGEGFDGVRALRIYNDFVNGKGPSLGGGDATVDLGG